MPQAGFSPAIPERMTVPSARFFAADWEAASFLEFFVDVQLRVSEDVASGAGRTVDRLADHARFALQLTLLRTVDSFVSYLAELSRAVEMRRSGPAWCEVVEAHPGATARGYDSLLSATPGVPADVGLGFEESLARGNLYRLGREFYAATLITLFESSGEVERVSRLSAMRNLVAHGRIFAAQDLAELVDETESVRGLNLSLRGFREDLDLLRAIVARVDNAAATRWSVETPVSSTQLFDAISRASALAEKDRPVRPPELGAATDPSVS
jgi:hypothetical protein